MIRVGVALLAMLGLCGYMFLAGTSVTPPAVNACGPSIIDTGHGAIMIDNGKSTLFIAKVGC
jgi:hypothetical protein